MKKVLLVNLEKDNKQKGPLPTYRLCQLLYDHLQDINKGESQRTCHNH